MGKAGGMRGLRNGRKPKAFSWTALDRYEATGSYDKEGKHTSWRRFQAIKTYGRRQDVFTLSKGVCFRFGVLPEVDIPLSLSSALRTSSAGLEVECGEGNVEMRVRRAGCQLMDPLGGCTGRLAPTPGDSRM
jgi:hypothetical protein